jgi:hypothetical protein
MSIVDRTTPTQKAAVSAAGAVSVDTELLAVAVLADATANPTPTSLGTFPHIFNGTTWDRVRSVVAGQDTTGTGILASGMLAQFDDATPAAVSENQFAPLRLSTRRALLVEGVASGTNVNVNVAASTTITVDTELPVAGALADAAGNPTTPTVGAGALLFNGSTWDRMRGDITNGLDVDVTRVTGTVTVDSELPVAAVLADATANPTVPGVGTFLHGYNGTTWDRVRTANTGRLQVDVITGGGVDTPTTPALDTASSSGTAAGASANLDTADLGGLTRKLWQCLISSSVAWKAVIGTFENGASVKTLATLFGRAGETVSYKPAHRDFASDAFSANAGFDGFRAVVTNLDSSEAADLYASFEYSA